MKNHMIQGSFYDHAPDYAQPQPQQPRAIFAAALQLLDSEPDILARIMLLRDAYPQASLREIIHTLRDVALLFHLCGVRRAPGAVVNAGPQS